MRTFLAYFAAFAVVTLLVIGLAKLRFAPGGPVPNYDIPINNCSTTVEPNAHSGETITFYPDNNYQVTFVATSTPHGLVFPVPTPQFLIAPSSAGHGVHYTVKGPSDCLPKPQGCYYKYILSRPVANGDFSQCSQDPGIHIVP